ncbi:TetR/AcrR family transcriptional regulator [Alcanivorax sp. DP30]|uniref:TetR/AcrR family transcriptional regulator n=1 Tax=Alcanivorax sp. DP30 TaxID=2606217 RepID=UPI0013705448|nr:TetR/AcrR family transcriptional regulator [Alcanivorax sp. DP30]MZR64138.1 TetR family transcriptional regulator [Alcanivorax sp. DP30]
MERTRKPQQERAKKTVEAIIEAGFMFISRQSKETLTTTKVADIAGVSVGTLYEYFGNKEEILDAMYARFSEDVTAMLREVTPEVIRKTPDQGILHILQHLREMLSRDNQRYLHCAALLSQNLPEQHVAPIRQVLATLSLQYLSRNPEYINLPNLPVMNYIMTHGGIAALVHQLSSDDPMVTFDELSQGLATMARHMIEGSRRDAEQANP